MKTLILIIMVFCHIVDDYYLQGLLISMKQKSWWEKNYPEKMYKYDFLVALFMHSFSWSFMIMLAPTIYNLVINGTWYPIPFIINIVLHMCIDNEKANKKRINLLEDQLLHIAQIVITWACLIYLY